MNYLRATTGELIPLVPSDPARHHLHAFSDDCTGFLDDLDNVPRFVDAISYFSSAAGLKLNVAKTVISTVQT